MRKTLKPGLLACVLSAGVAQQPSVAADLTREARIATQISDAILEGEPVWLQAADTRFMAIYTASAVEPPAGALLLLHGRDAHPDWPDVIYPLRTRLPAQGWATLSIQLPVSAPDAPAGAWQGDLPLGAARIDAAAAWLAAKDFDQPVVIGHSLGARTAAEYLGGLHGRPAPVQGFVAIGLTANPADTEHGTLKALNHIHLPVLDLYGDQDFGGVIHSAAARRQAAGDAARYTQVQTPGADHFFRGRDDQLVERVTTWLSNMRAEP